MNRVFYDDAERGLAEIEPGTVQTAVTSPPLAVAKALGRSYVGVELVRRNRPLIEQRLSEARRLVA